MVDPSAAQPSAARCIWNYLRFVFGLPLYLFGTMRETAELLSWMRSKRPILVFPLVFVDAVLRGVGQIFFQNSPATGFIIVVAMFVEGWWEGVCSLLGLVISTSIGLLFGMSTTAVQNGLYGYNGFLCGAALALFLKGPWNGSTVVAIVLSSLFSSVRLRITCKNSNQCMDS